MLTRASRALPGMAVVALLIGLPFAHPALAGDQPTPNATAESRKATGKPHAARPHHVARVATAKPHPQPHTQAPAAADTLIRSDSTTAAIWRQTGVASWYGGARWQGNMTASGARYDQNQFTAAHATLPLGTRVRVTLEGTDRSVVVLINDRPGTRRRIIDLSRGAAAQLGIIKQGIAVVTLTPM